MSFKKKKRQEGKTSPVQGLVPKEGHKEMVKGEYVEVLCIHV
jgi:hypothetical protein